MKRLILAIVVVILAIIALIVGFWYLNESNEQATILQQELEAVTQVDLTEEYVNTEIKTTGNYAIVEETIKNYLNEIRQIYVDVSEYYSSEAISEILSAENILQDEEELSKVKEVLESTKEALEEEINKLDNMLEEDTIMEAIEEKGLKEYYNNIYSSVMLNEAVQSNLQYVRDEILELEETASAKLENMDDVIEFLEENKNYWEINDDKIQFTNVIKLTEYYELLNETV